jgi:hypothetical protein
MLVLNSFHDLSADADEPVFLKINASYYPIPLDIKKLQKTIFRFSIMGFDGPAVNFMFR